jgi:hypothetical protein
MIAVLPRVVQGAQVTDICKGETPCGTITTVLKYAKKVGGFLLKYSEMRVIPHLIRIIKVLM